MSTPRGRLHTLATPPPRSSPPWHRLLVVPRDGTLKALALAEAVTGVMRHYDRRSGRMHACTSPHEPCLHCAARIGALWSGYLPVLLREGDRYAGRTLVVTQEGFRNSPALQAGQLRGRWVHCWRMVSRHNGPARFTVGDLVANPEQLPAAWDIEEELAIRFGLLERGDAEEGQTG